MPRSAVARGTARACLGQACLVAGALGLAAAALLGAAPRPLALVARAVRLVSRPVRVVPRPVRLAPRRLLCREARAPGRAVGRNLLGTLGARRLARLPLSRLALPILRHAADLALQGGDAV